MLISKIIFLKIKKYHFDIFQYEKLFKKQQQLHLSNLKDVSKIVSVSSSLSKLTAVCYLAIPQFQGILEKQHLCHDPIVIIKTIIFIFGFYKDCRILNL
jgi:hypothetical protein